MDNLHNSLSDVQPMAIGRRAIMLVLTKIYGVKYAVWDSDNVDGPVLLAKTQEALISYVGAEYFSSTVRRDGLIWPVEDGSLECFLDTEEMVALLTHLGYAPKEVGG